VVLQRLRENGFDGQITIVRDYLRHLRGPQKKRQAFLRFESLPGEQVQIDRVHFGSLLYEEAKIKPYALAALEASAACFMWNLPTARTRLPCINVF